MKLSLGPILYFWQRQAVYEFYESMLDTDLDCIYLGETVCSKRNEMRLSDWLDIADIIAASGKQVILSSMALVESRSGLSALRKLCDQEGLMVEANDMAAVAELVEFKLAFVAGASINIYNAQTLNILFKRGLRRWVMPVELNATTLKCILDDASTMGFAESIETEVFSYGRLPLAYSARCFTARAKNRSKDECKLACKDYPDGLHLSTQENQNLLTLNGTQVQSSACYNLLNQKKLMESMGVDFMRLSPQQKGMEEVVQRFSGDDSDPLSMAPSEQCNGYWFGEPGMFDIE